MNSVHISGTIHARDLNNNRAWITTDERAWIQVYIPPPFTPGWTILKERDEVEIEGYIEMTVGPGNKPQEAYVVANRIKAIKPAVRAKVANKMFIPINNNNFRAMQQGQQLYTEISSKQSEVWRLSSKVNVLEEALIKQKKEASAAILQMMSGSDDASSQA